MVFLNNISSKYLEPTQYFCQLYNVVLVLPYINMNPPWVYTCSQSWTPFPPSPLHHPSRSSQRTSPKHPAPCIEARLAIHFLYDIKHISMPFSQIIPPSPSPKESKRLFYTKWNTGFLNLSCGRTLYNLIKAHYYLYVYKYFIPVCCLSFHFLDSIFWKAKSFNFIVIPICHT